MKTSLEMDVHPQNTIRLDDLHGSFKLYHFKHGTTIDK